MRLSWVWGPWLVLRSLFADDRRSARGRIVRVAPPQPPPGSAGRGGPLPHAPGLDPGEGAAEPDRGAVDIDGIDARGGLGRRVEGRAVRDRVGVEDDEVREVAFAHAA